jgi:hypothetical protein
MPNSSISVSGLNRNPQNINIYSSGYDPSPSLTSSHFSIFETASGISGFSFKKETTSPFENKVSCLSCHIMFVGKKTGF